MKKIYDFVKDKMLGIGAKHFDLWNGQLEGTQTNSQPFNFPCVFINFQEVKTQPEGNKRLRCLTEFRLYVGWQYYIESQKDNAIIGGNGLVEFSRQITKALHGNRGIDTNTISQRSFRTSAKYSNVYTLEMDFVTEYIEDIASPNLQVAVPAPDLVVEPLAYIQNFQNI